MMLIEMSNKTLLKIILFFEIIITFLIIIGVLPREFSFSIIATMFLFIIRANIVDSLILVILSIPFYLALPLSASFDSMASWRIIIFLLFLKYAFKKITISKDKILKFELLKREKIKSFIFEKNIRFEILATIFAIISFFSLIGAHNQTVGVKKILFLINIFLLFIIVKNLTQNKIFFLKILKAVVLSGIFIVFIGLIQLISIFFISLANFWQFWTENIIAGLYGIDLSILLSYSNTWFSYYEGNVPPTLRMFSFFPDSHSFALFNIILIPFILTLINNNKNNIKNKIFYWLLLIFVLLAIIFSGSRGAWVSAGMTLGIVLLFKILINNYILDKPISTNHKIYGEKIKKIFSELLANNFKFILSIFILFFMLFPVSSIILEQTQKAEWRRLNLQGNFSSFAMYHRLSSIVNLDEISNKGRLEIWRDTFISVKKHPLLGVGIGNFTTVIGKNVSATKKGASAHNLFLDILAETGILGLIVFLAIFYEIFKMIFSILKNTKDKLFEFFALGAGVYFFWILGYSFFDVVLFNDKVLLLFMIEIGLLQGIDKMGILSKKV